MFTHVRFYFYFSRVGEVDSETRGSFGAWPFGSSLSTKRPLGIRSFAYSPSVHDTHARERSTQMLCSNLMHS